MRPQPVTVAQAAERLRRAPGTIYSWATRYGVRKWGDSRRTLYDYNDLATIDGCMRRGEDVPATSEGRDDVRDQLRERYRNAA